MAERAVYKSTAAEFLDEMFGGSPEELEVAYASSLELIDATSDGRLSEAAARLVDDRGLPQEAVEHSDAGWRASAEVDRVLRAGYREAIRLARDREVPVPIDTLWVTGVVEDEFEIHICETEKRVTILLFIPLTRSYGSENARSRSWVVRAGGSDDAEESWLEDDGEPLVMVQKSGAGSEASAS